VKTGQDLVDLLGRASDDADVVDALAEYGVRWPPVLDLPEDGTDDEEDEPDWYVWRPSSARGIEFGFQDRAHFEADDPSLRGEGDLLLTSIAFFGQHQDVDPFAGRLPWSLELSDSRTRVREKLNVLEASPRVHLRDVWEAGDRRVIVQHTRRDTIANVLVRLPSRPWPDPEPAPIARPNPAQLRAMFDMHWHEEPMKKWLFPLGLGECGTDIAIHRHADLGHHGLELYFFRDPSRADDSPIKDKGAVMRGVKFLANRAYDAAQWQGDLPFGLSFLTAYPDLVAAVGRKPDELADDDLGGYALWHFDDFTMHVEHDNVDNLLWAISMFAPGAWNSAC